MTRVVLDLVERRPIWSIPEWAARRIQAALPVGWEWSEVGSPADGRGDGSGGSAEALASVQGAEVYLGFGMPPQLFAAATTGSGASLRWVHSATAGVGGSLHPELRRSDVVLTNSAGIYAEPIADSVLAAILYFARGLDFAVAAQRESRWAPGTWEASDAPLLESADCTVGILGYGGIGRAVARRAAALGMPVRALRRNAAPGADGLAEIISGTDALDTLLAGSGILVVALPETEATRGMLGVPELNRLPRGAIVINVSRGGVLNEAALAEALTRGHLRGAALDVFQTEPLPHESPLWGLSNVLVTPHVSGTSHHFWRRQTELIVENIRRYAAGEPLLNVVDKQAGY